MSIVAFGPVRVIGLSYTGPVGDGQLSGLWHQLMGRVTEIQQTDSGLGFGICRCVEGAPEGQFEYIAAFSATPTAPIPEGMVEVTLPAVDYYIKKVPTLEAIQSTWSEAVGEVAALEGWKPFCGQDGCDCATAPSFELYPSDFKPEIGLDLYIPIRKA